tara:strand:+ start:1017 stop:1121 length:105 start_codon:yes stop_codon:yes gene_type:complete
MKNSGKSFGDDVIKEKSLRILDDNKTIAKENVLI